MIKLVSLLKDLIIESNMELSECLIAEFIDNTWHYHGNSRWSFWRLHLYLHINLKTIVI